MALGSGLAVPIGCGGEILFHTLAGFVEKPEIELRKGVTLIGGFAKPIGSFDGVGRLAPSFEIKKTKMRLRLRMALLRGFLIPLQRLSLVFGNALPLIVE